MKSLSISIFTLLILSSCPNHTAGQSSECARFQEEDDLLNSNYQLILEDYKNDSNFIEKFKSSQRAWLEFRDAHLKAIFPEDSEGYYGSIKKSCDCIYLTELTMQRNKQLETWIVGVEEGEVCAGSVKIN